MSSLIAPTIILGVWLLVIIAIIVVVILLIVKVCKSFKAHFARVAHIESKLVSINEQIGQMNQK
jgi:flagellar biogenesis protein FliO